MAPLLPYRFAPYAYGILQAAITTAVATAIAVFPVDDMTLDYLRLTGRDERQVVTVEGEVRQPGQYPVGASMTLLRAIARALVAVPRCWAIIRRVRPEVVLAGGGYVCAPAAIAALLWGGLGCVGGVSPPPKKRIRNQQHRRPPVLDGAEALYADGEASLDRPLKDPKGRPADFAFALYAR